MIYLIAKTQPPLHINAIYEGGLTKALLHFPKLRIPGLPTSWLSWELMFFGPALGVP